ncbi:hypothetical protein JTL67_36200, partial [Pseudomonas aeruginosa]|nr:hypothetical protein [Pseudomonas aeruginosa]
MQKTVARFRNSEFVDNRALAMAVADAGQCKAPEISLAELLAAAPGNSAQHSVPEVSGIGRDFAYPRSVVLYLRTEPTDDDLRAIHDGLRSLA